MDTSGNSADNDTLLLSLEDDPDERNLLTLDGLAGDVIPGADGARKIRWSRAGTGKSSGARVIYFNFNEDEIVLLLTVYAKAERANMSPAEISKVV